MSSSSIYNEKQPNPGQGGHRATPRPQRELRNSKIDYQKLHFMRNVAKWCDVHYQQLRFMRNGAKWCDFHDRVGWQTREIRFVLSDIEMAAWLDVEFFGHT